MNNDEEQIESISDSVIMTLLIILSNQDPLLNSEKAVS